MNDIIFYILNNFKKKVLGYILKMSKNMLPQRRNNASHYLEADVHLTLHRIFRKPPAKDTMKKHFYHNGRFSNPIFARNITKLTENQRKLGGIVLVRKHSFLNRSFLEN